MNQIASDIMAQLGGHKFVVMTGARDIVALDRGVKFRIGRNASKANMIRVTLTSMDTYIVEFIKRGRELNPVTLLAKVFRDGMSESEFNTAYELALQKAKKASEDKVLHTVSGVYCDTIQQVFTAYTGMNTHL